MKTQVKKPTTHGKDIRGKEEVDANPQVVEEGAKLREDMDKLLDDIEDVLEENAEEFVKGYIQKGGQ